MSVALDLPTDPAGRPAARSAAPRRDAGTPGFGLYVHWPFCAAKCPYCDFNSHVRHAAPDQARYGAALARQLEAFRAQTGPREVTSVFIGGGTPSLMEPRTVEAVLAAADRLYGLPAGIEITMEANPQSADAGRFGGYRSAGVNRLSLGVQALNDADLRFLGRLHDAGEAREAIDLARRVFPRLSFDLIYARPNQTLAGWRAELEQAIDLAADHLSLYQLTIEDGTAFRRLYEARKFALPEDALSADLYALTGEVTERQGLPRYEVSNHAEPDAESRHNLTYWRYGDYVGIGPGAHGRFVPDGESGTKHVTIGEALPERWLAAIESGESGLVETEDLDRDQQADEMLLMGLRLKEGLDLPRYEAMAGRAIPARTLQSLQMEGLVEMVGNDRLRASDRGMVLLDALIAQLAG